MTLCLSHCVFQICACMSICSNVNQDVLNLQYNHKCVNKLGNVIHDSFKNHSKTIFANLTEVQSNKLNDDVLTWSLRLHCSEQILVTTSLTSLARRSRKALVTDRLRSPTWNLCNVRIKQFGRNGK